jgi:hypothetical protein
MEGEPLGDAAKGFEHAVHVRGVEGMADVQALGFAPRRLNVPGDVEDGVFVSGDDGGGRAVERGDGDAALASGEVGLDLVLGRWSVTMAPP